MTVRLEPDEFRLVLFDAAELGAIAADVAARLGMADEEITVAVDETSALGGLDVESLEPVRLRIDSGAIEDPQRIRKMSAARAAEAIGRLLLESGDRRRPGFGAPALGEDVPPPVRITWDLTLLGRLAPVGLTVRQAPRRYRFRVLHGFTDVADEAFDRLWGAEPASYAELEAASAAAAAGAQARS